MLPQEIQHATMYVIQSNKYKKNTRLFLTDLLRYTKVLYTKYIFSLFRSLCIASSSYQCTIVISLSGQVW